MKRIGQKAVNPSNFSHFAFWGVLFVFSVIACAVYYFSLFYPLQYDDFVNVAFNRAIRYLEHPRALIESSKQRIRLLTNLSYALNYAVSGMNIVHYRVTNILLHGLNAGLLCLLLLRLFPFQRGLAFLVSLLFCIHPLTTESVIYLSGRSNLLMFFFLLGGLVLFFYDGKAKKESLRHFLLRSVGLYLFFALSVLSKESGVLLLLWFVLLARFSQLSWYRIGIASAPIVLTCCFAFYWKFSYMKAAYAGIFHGPDAASMTILQWYYTQISLLPKILGLFWVNGWQSIHHPVKLVHSFSNIQFLFGFILLLVASVVAINPRKIFSVNIALASGLFLTSLVPTNGVAPLPDIFAERHLYPAVAVFFLFILLLFSHLSMRVFIANIKRYINLVAATVMVAFVFNGLITVGKRWQSAEHLWQHAVKLYHDDYRSALNYTNAILENTGDIEKANSALLRFFNAKRATHLSYTEFNEALSVYRRLLRRTRTQSGLTKKLLADVNRVSDPLWQVGLQTILCEQSIEHDRFCTRVVSAVYAESDQKYYKILKARAYIKIGNSKKTRALLEDVLENEFHRIVAERKWRLEKNMDFKLREAERKLQYSLQESFIRLQQLTKEIAQSVQVHFNQESIEESSGKIVANKEKINQLELLRTEWLHLKDEREKMQKFHAETRKQFNQEVALEGIEMYQKFRDRSHFWPARRLLADIYYTSGEVDRAIDQWEVVKRKLRTFNRIDPNLWEKLARSYESKEDFRRAADSWGDLVAILVDNAEYRRAYAENLKRVGLVKRAKRHLDQSDYYEASRPQFFAKKEIVRAKAF